MQTMCPWADSDRCFRNFVRGGFRVPEPHHFEHRLRRSRASLSCFGFQVNRSPFQVMMPPLYFPLHDQRQDRSQGRCPRGYGPRLGFSVLLGSRLHFRCLLTPRPYYLVGCQQIQAHQPLPQSILGVSPDSPALLMAASPLAVPRLHPPHRHTSPLRLNAQHPARLLDVHLYRLRSPSELELSQMGYQFPLRSDQLLIFFCPISGFCA